MKKLLLGMTLVTAVSLGAQAQTTKEGGLYMAIHGGYNTTVAGTSGIDYLGGMLAGGIPMLTANGEDDKLETPTYSFGKGTNVGINIGYMFNRNVGVELGADYLLGGKNNFKIKEEDDISETSVHAKMIQLRPTMRIAAGKDKINPYAKVGLVIGVGGSIDSELEITDGTDKTSVILVKDQGIAFGFTGAGGVDFSINEKMSIFSEISFTGLSFNPKKGKITKAEFNGEDQLPNIDVRQKEYDYVKSADISAGDADTPQQLPKTSQNFNSMGINIGLKIRI